MTEIPCQDYIEKILLLENHSHRKRKYEIFNPIDYNGLLEIIEIQRISKSLSNHIGYDGLVFTIATKEFNSNTAGNITLDYNEDVLIHISKSLWGYPESILATISHEISHKFIQLNRLTFSLTYENEVFTDLTSIFLGFGKLMLNGVEVIQKTTMGNTVRTITKNVGYLNRDQLAFIYLVVNYSQGVSRLNFYSHLRSEVIEAVKKIEEKYSIFFKNMKYYKKVSQEINDLRYKIAYLEKLTSIQNPSNLIEIKDYIRCEFNQLNEVEKELLDFKKEFLSRIIAKPNEARKIRKEIPTIKINTSEYNKLLKQNRKLTNRELNNSISYKRLNVIECPSCKKNLKLKNDTIGIVICPNCNFKFAVDTICNIDNSNLFFAIQKILAKIKEYIRMDRIEKRRFNYKLYEKIKLFWLIN